MVMPSIQLHIPLQEKNKLAFNYSHNKLISYSYLCILCVLNYYSSVMLCTMQYKQKLSECIKYCKRMHKIVKMIVLCQKTVPNFCR